MNLETLKKFSHKAGEITATAKAEASQFAERNDLKNKTLTLKEAAKEQYEEKTGRSAAVDSTILKYSAVATAAALAVSTAPAAIVVGAVGAGLYATTAKPLIAKINQEYNKATGRDAVRDAETLKTQAITVSSECATSFKQGMQSAESKMSSNAIQ
jgi:hypothetical protein